MLDESEVRRLAGLGKGHVLYPVLNYVAKSQYENECRMNRLETSVKSINSVLTELRTLQEGIAKQSFSLKESQYMVRINSNQDV